MMLLGEYTQPVNSQGQLLIPEQVLAELTGNLVLTRGFERNLLLFSGASWKHLAEKILDRPISLTEIRAFRRRLFSGAIELSPDADGRIRIPAALREFAGIDDEAIVAGMYDHLELWSADQWEPALKFAEATGNGDRWDGTGI